MVKEMTSCCCGCSLRTGTLIIGMLGVFVSVTTITNGFFGPEWTMVPIFHNTTTDLSENGTMEENSTESFNVKENATEFFNATKLFIGRHKFKITYQGITGCMELVLCMMLLLGTLKERPRLVYPWIAVNIILCVVSVIVNIILMIFVIEVGGFFAGFLYLGLVCLAASIHVYCLMVVNSFYNNLVMAATVDAYA